MKMKETGLRRGRCLFPPSWIHQYRSGTVNSKSFVGKDFLPIKWKYELTVHFQHEMIAKTFHRNFE